MRKNTLKVRLPGVAIALILACPATVCAADGILDQVNSPSGSFKTASFSGTRAGQTFIPAMPQLVAVEIEIQSATALGLDMSVWILDDQRSLATFRKSVPPGFSGWLRIDLPSGGVPVVPGRQYTLQLDEGIASFLWKYGGNTYPNGEAWSYGMPMNGGESDFFFRTYGSNSTNCSYSVAPLSVSALPTGGNTTVNVTAAPGCTWTASSGTSWITLGTSATSGAGNGTSSFSVATNSSSTPRTGTLRVAGQTVYVNQPASGQTASSLASLAQNGIVNAANGATPIAPGSFVTIYGLNLSDVTDTWSSAIPDGVTLPTALRGVKVLLNGQDCYPSFVSPGQINVLTPPGMSTGTSVVEVFTARGTLAATVEVVENSPAWFSYTAQGTAYIAALTVPDNSYVAPVAAIAGITSRPAKPGEYVQLYANGLGATNPAYPTGRIMSTAYPVADVSKLKVMVGGKAAEIGYAGMISPGLYQINVRIPDGIASGNLPGVLSIGSRSSQPNAMLAVESSIVPPSSTCMNLAGRWMGVEMGTAQWTITSERGTSIDTDGVVGSAATLTISQTGCDITYAPLGLNHLTPISLTPADRNQLTQKGTVTGTQFQSDGPAGIAQQFAGLISNITVIENTMHYEGTVVDSVAMPGFGYKDINLTGTGVLSFTGTSSGVQGTFRGVIKTKVTLTSDGWSPK